MFLNLKCLIKFDKSWEYRETWDNIEETKENRNGRVEDWNWLLEDGLSQAASHYLVGNNLPTGILDENCPVC